jgi:hypothetical protein
LVLPVQTSEIFPQNNLEVKYLDINAGILYNGSTNGYNNIYFGASMYHINRPKETFQGGQFYLNSRTTLQGVVVYQQINTMLFTLALTIASRQMPTT